MMSEKSEASLSFRVKTYGCKVNSYDSSLIENRLKTNLKLQQNQDVDVHILNSCAVTAEATKEVIREARKIKIKNPNSFVVVTGCSAQVDTELLIEQSHVDLVVANSHKSELESLIRNKMINRDSPKLFKSNIFKKEDLESGGGVDVEHTRSFLKIQDGCNSFCTFCVIPFARGKSRSLTIDHLRSRVRELVESGVKEVVLTGVHIGDFEYGLENLVEDILLNTRISRLRLSSLEPIEISDRLLDLFEDPRLCPHFHMSIQSATSSVLTRMKRQYKAEDVTGALEKIRAQLPHAYIGMDVITGFPGESEDDFQETYTRLASLPWTKIHVFPYSERPGTFAVKLDGKNTPMTIHRRADQLRNLSASRYQAEIEQQIGTTKKVLVLNEKSGLSRDYWPVQFTKLKNREEFNTESKVKVHSVAHKEKGGEPILLVSELLN